ncbi:MAG: glycosyltransferase family 2 protein [Candidatus Aenigmarchaeota archaeon]|nr:glycosyltransferase family 2 protein [Candidatus Aenigmarchaeota archaeon]
MKTAIVIPAYNEEKTISAVVKKAKKFGSVIVVNDASRDKTAVFARTAGAFVINHKVNRGLGGSLRTGFDAAIKKGFDIVITLDADGQHNPEDIPKFIEKIDNNYDFVLGKRDLSKYPFVKKIGNFFLNLLTNFVTGTTLSDTESGFRAFKASSLKKLKLKSERYEIAAEIIREVGRNKLRCANVSVSSPVYRAGVGVIDGVKNFLYILKR